MDNTQLSRWLAHEGRYLLREMYTNSIAWTDAEIAAINGKD